MIRLVISGSDARDTVARISRIVVASALLVASRLEAAPSRVAGCPVDPDDTHVVVVDASVISLHQPGYRCANDVAYQQFNIDDAMKFLDGAVDEASPAGHGRPTESTGCALVFDSPNCASTGRVVVAGGAGHLETDAPNYIDLELDGARRRITYLTSMWRACDLAPGTHTVQLCTDDGPLTCAVAVAASAIAVQTIQRVPATAELRIEHAYQGAVQPGQVLSVQLEDRGEQVRFALPTRGTFFWRTDTPTARATQCTAAHSAPGCSRCAADGGQPPWWLAVTVFGLLVVRRRRWR
jgi:MYXO-CTERM domain-containing protein